MIYIGIDNGTSGSIGIIDDATGGGNSIFKLTPTFKEQSYTKSKKIISRINVVELEALLNTYAVPVPTAKVIMERPMVNPGRFMATVSALRALEATLIVVERLKLPRQYIDSKQWQKELLPQGLKGSDELKKASCDIGCRLFPQHA